MTWIGGIGGEERRRYAYTRARRSMLRKEAIRQARKPRGKEEEEEERNFICLPNLPQNAINEENSEGISFFALRTFFKDGVMQILNESVRSNRKA